MHEVERLVDIFEAHRMRNEFIDLDIAVHVLFHHAGQLRFAFTTSKSSASPDATCDQLERTCADFLTRTRDPDDYGFSPALVAAFECCPHQIDVADAFEGIIHAAIGHFDDNFLDRVAMVHRIDGVRCTHLGGQFELVRIDIHCNDPTGLCHHGTLDS